MMVCVILWELTQGQIPMTVPLWQHASIKWPHSSSNTQGSKILSQNKSHFLAISKYQRIFLRPTAHGNTFPNNDSSRNKKLLIRARQRCWEKTIIIHYFTSPLLPATVTHDESLLMHVLLVPLHNQSLVGCILTPLPLPPKCLLTAEVGFIFQKLRKAVVGEERTCWPAICHVVSWRGMWGSSLFRMNEEGYLGEITEKKIDNNKHASITHYQNCPYMSYSSSSSSMEAL